MKRAVLLIPLAWVLFGIGEVVALDLLLRGISRITPTVPNDKPIGGSLLPVIFLNLIIVLVTVVISLYGLGVWRLNIATLKAKLDLFAFSTLVLSGFVLWYNPIALFPMVAALLYFLAVNLN